MQTYTKHIPKLTYVYINICKHKTTKHIPKLTYVYITYANMKLPNIYQN